MSTTRRTKGVDMKPSKYSVRVYRRSAHANALTLVFATLVHVYKRYKINYTQTTKPHLLMNGQYSNKALSLMEHISPMKHIVYRGQYNSCLLLYLALISGLLDFGDGTQDLIWPFFIGLYFSSRRL